MGLIVKHVVQTKTGTYTYRRRVPKGLREVLGKTEIKKTLGKSQSQALKRYNAIHKEVEQLLQSAQLTAASNVIAPKTDFEVHREALRRLNEVGFNEVEGFGLDDDGESLHREVISDQLTQEYPVDTETGYPIIDNPVVSRQLLILNSASPVKERYRFTDAVSLYFDEKVKGSSDEKRKRNRIDLVSTLVLEALGRDPFIDSIKKRDAREVREFMLSDKVLTGSTARRYLNDIRAILNVAIDQFDLDRTSNPFSNLSIPASSGTKDDRRAFTKGELIDVRGRIQTHVNPELQLIWKMLQDTGCRMAEITGLLVSDVRLKDPIPHLVIQVHPHRRLKTKGSARLVPLVGGALIAAEKQIQGKEDSDVLFSRYGGPRGSDAASGALMKQIRKVTKDRKVTNHSLRHLMADKLRLAGVTQVTQDSILGHSSGNVADNYGGPEMRLRLAQEALMKALKVDF
ncbi:MAG: hypothetical protein CBC34_011440 [Hyphomicrobiaceae bacterium TMED74]|nr:MAG: hypothetical protein CBC34_011440 [Hyphomicrobiaceae bacterium TMED74]